MVCVCCIFSVCCIFGVCVLCVLCVLYVHPQSGFYVVCGVSRYMCGVFKTCAVCVCAWYVSTVCQVMSGVCVWCLFSV